MNPSRGSFLRAAAACGFAVGLRATARAAEPLRMAFVPEVATTPASIAAKQPWVDYFEKALGRPVHLDIPTNYAAVVEAIGNGSVDLAYFGGLTYLKARARYGVVPVAQRVEDQHFHSLFITNDPALTSLKALKGKTFAFGDVNSTSGHLEPAAALIAAGLDPETDLVARFTGNHTTTALAVNAGQVVAGALDETVYHKMVADKTIDPAKTRVFFSQGPFVDYVWVVRKDTDPASVASIRKAFLGIKDPSVLAVTRATAYVAVDDSAYAPLRAVAVKLNLL